MSGNRRMFSRNFGISNSLSDNSAALVDLLASGGINSMALSR